jgi:hypothetical protein
MSSPGVVVLNCAPNLSNWQLSIYDPTSGQVLGQETIPTSFNTNIGQVNVALDASSCRNSASFNRLAAREMFDSSLSEVAVMSAQQTDGSQHVGYVNLASGAFTDLTTSTSGSGFSGHIPVDNAPVFDQATGDMWFFRDDGGIYHCSPSGTCAVAAHVDQPDQNSHFYVINGGWQLTPATNDPALLDTSGRIAAIEGNNTQNLGATYDLAVERGGQEPRRGLYTLSDPKGGTIGNDVNCYPEAWVSETSLICSASGGGSQFWYVSGLAAGKPGTRTARRLLPTNERQDDSPVISPDGKRFVFRSTGGSITALYVQPVNAKRLPAPRRLVSVGATEVPIAWQ